MPDTVPPLPPNEAKRLETLQRLGILDTLPEQAYDDLTLLASQICRTPISMLALIDAERQWYKSTVGTLLKQTPRNVAFCAHAIVAPGEIFTVEDAHDDPRFVDNPFVTGEPHIRFYAGASIVMPSGEAIGTLCVIDTEPRRLTEAEARCLQALARQASLLLDLREKAMASERVARESEKTSVEARLKQKRGMELLELVLRGGQMGLWDLHVPSGVWTVNAREQVMLGYAGVEAPAKPLDWRALIHPDDLPAVSDAMEPHLEGRASFYESTHRMRHADGHYLWVLDRGVIVERDVRGEALRIIGTHVDVTRQKQREDAVRRSAERLELALSGGDHGLWDWHVPSGRVVRDRQGSRMSGHPHAESERVDRIDDLWKIIAFDEDLARARIEMQRHLVGLTPMFEAELRTRRRNGDLLWVLFRAKVFERDDQGRAVRVVGTSMDITARKAGEVALQQASALLHRTAVLARVGGWTIELPSRSVTWSDEVYRLHDLNPAEKPALHQVLGFLTDASRPVIAAAIDRAIADAMPWDLEVAITTARGRSLWVRSIGQPEREGDQVVRIVGTSQDITDRKEAELGRIASNRQMRLMADCLPALITRLDREQRYTFVNREVERIFAIDRDEMIGRSMQDVRTIRAGLAYETIAAHVAAVLAGERVVFEGYTQVRGRPYHYQTHYEPDTDEAGAVNGFFTMTFDVTDRKLLELRRTESEARLRGITDSLPALVAEIDTKGRYRFANATHQAWLGLAPEALIGKPIPALLQSTDRDARAHDLHRAFAGEKVSFVQTLDLTIGTRCLQTTYLPHRDVAGNVAGIYALTSDITELTEAQARLAQLDRNRSAIAS